MKSGLDWSNALAQKELLCNTLYCWKSCSMFSFMLIAETKLHVKLFGRSSYVELIVISLASIAKTA